MAEVTPLTMATAKARAQALLDEPGVSAITSSQWLTLGNSALMEVFQLIVDVNPDQLLSTMFLDYTANADSELIAGPAIYGDFYRLVGVLAYTTATPNYATDIPYRLTPIRFSDLTAYRRRGTMGGYSIDGSTRTPGFYATSGSTTTLSIHLAPVPVSTVHLNVQFVTTPAPLVDDTTAIDLPTEYQDSFVRRIASLANIRTGGRNQAVEMAWQTAAEMIKRTAGPKVDDEPRQVHYIPDGWGYW